MTGRPRLWLTAVTTAAVVATGARTAIAQLVIGVAHERGGAAPLAGAAVSLVDTAGQGAGFFRAGDTGRFRLIVPAPGRYAIDVRRLGFAPWRSPYFEVGATDTLHYDAVLERLPQELARVLVRSEREDLLDLKFMGMDPRSFGGNLITPSQMERASIGARHFGDVIAHAGPPWVFYDGAAQCVKSVRSRGCLAVYVDDMRYAKGDDLDAQWSALFQVDPASIDHMLVLGLADVGLLFGTINAPGVLLIWTKAYTRQLRQMQRRR